MRTRTSSVGRVVVMVFLLAASMALSGALAQEGEEKTTVEVRGLRLVGEAYGDEWRGLRAFNWTPGTSVAVLVQRPAGGIIDMDEDKSKIAALTDDKGTNLLEGGKFGTMGFSFTNVAEDSRALMTELKGPKVPAAGATKINAEGTLVLLAATEQKTVKTDVGPVEKGRKLKAGPFEWEITKAGAAEGRDEFTFTLTSHKALRAVKEMKFVDDEGNELKVQGRGTWTVHREQVRVDSNYAISKAPANLGIVVTYWVDMQEVEVPFDLSTGIGLGE